MHPINNLKQKKLFKSKLLEGNSSDGGNNGLTILMIMQMHLTYKYVFALTDLIFEREALQIFNIDMIFLKPPRKIFNDEFQYKRICSQVRSNKYS